MIFITFEGGEGSGKSTQIKNVLQYLEEREYRCLITREPGGTEIGGQIRKILKSVNSEKLVPKAELMLFLADRVQHIEWVIGPALERGDVVLCDRYFDSTFAYQGTARNLKVDLRELHQMFEVPIPDLTFLLDLPPSLGLSRAWSQINSGGRDRTQVRFEEEQLSFHEDLRRGYLHLATKEPNRFCVIDAKFTEENVWQQIKKVLDTIF